MKSLFFTALLVLGTGTLTAQIDGGPLNVPTNGIIDGVVIQEHIPTKRMIPYEFVREADVIWSKRVWQTIDMREKMNHPMYFPFDDYDAANNWVKNSSRWSLWTVLKTHIMSGDIRVFSPYNLADFNVKDGDQLKYPIDPQTGMNFYTDSAFRSQMFYYLGSLGPQSLIAIPNMYNEDSVIIVDGIEEKQYPPRDTTWIKTKDVIQYRMKEDWFFDKERSVIEVRILAIAPVVYETDESGQIQGMKELFWLYFPHCRFVLNNYFVYNDKNDAQWMSFDDLFWKRRFTSVIYKESNVFDRKMETYKTGIDALFEAEKVKEEIRTIEHDVWTF
ncbi:MAG: gliding motility protein GldN [Flavobacteriia bacterium]|nr:gliding motility protein GldN [Flavobacteriia bacterium]